MGDAHKGSAWNTARDLCLANATHCALCGGALDWAAKAPHPAAPSADHIIPVSKGGPHYDQWNLQPAHLGCNKRKYNRTDTLPPLTTSREW